MNEHGGSRQGKAHCKNLYRTMTQLSLTLQRDPASLFWDKTWIIKLMRKKKKIPKDTAVLAVELPLAKFQ